MAGLVRRCCHWYLLFKLYALDVMLGDLGKATKSAVESAMKSHVLEQVTLIGTYQKHG